MADANQRYHDRIAPRYDDVYADDPYWDLYHDISWRALKVHLPTDMAHPVLDVGCGTGLYGLKLAKSRFRVAFSDFSRRMLDVAERKATAQFPHGAFRFEQADILDLAPFADAEFSLVVAQGDPLSFCSDWKRGLRSVRRVLRTNGVAVLSVDSRFGGCEPFLARQDLAGLSAFLKCGDSEWLADRREERFPLHAFAPQELRDAAARSGFEVLSLIGKTVFATRNSERLGADAAYRQALLRLEEEWNGTEFGLARGHHLQIALRRKD